MRKFTSFLYVAVFTIATFVAFNKEAKASHAAGGEIVYEWLGDSTYRFFFKFYRDCTGISQPTSVSLCFFNSCTNTTFNRTMTQWTGTVPPYNQPNGSPVSAGCSQYTNKCQNSSSSVPGYREWWYSVIETLPLACNSWKFAVWISARNNSNNIVGGNLYVETIFNSSFTWANSSPYFSIKPIPYVCVNQQYTYNNGAIDPNGDSLVSQIINPLVGSSCQNAATNIGLVNQTPVISFPTNPLQTGNNNFSLNTATGQMSFTATQQGASTLSIRTTEYRNNQFLGSIIRDVQVQVLPCSAVVPKIDTPSIVTTVTGGQWLNNQVNGCIDQKIEFCFDIESQDTGAIIIVEDNHASSIPAATMTYTNQKTDSVRGCFSWTPGAADAGLNNIILTMKDSTCRPPGILLVYAITVPIYVWPTTKAVPDTSICSNEAAFLGVTGGGNYTWTVLPGGDQNSLNNPNIPNPVATPNKTSTYVVTSGASSFCKDNSDTVTVNVLQGPSFQGQDDVIGCPGKTISLNIKPTATQGAKYNYKWTPATYLSSDTISNPTTNTPVDITYIVVVGSDKNNCKARDTVNIDVLDGFNLDNPDTVICEGETIEIRGKGDTRYTYNWVDTSGSTLSSPGTLITKITPIKEGTNTYVLRASYTGCDDSLASITIEAQPIPTVTVSPDASICFDDTISVKGEVIPASYTGYTYKWTPGSSLNDDAILNPIFKGTATTTLSLRVASSVGCADTEQVTISVYPADFLQVSSDTAICPGDTASLTLTVPVGTKYTWSPDINISSTDGLTPKAWPVANRLYTIYGVDPNNCKDTANVKIVVRPKAILHLPDSVRIYPKESYQMDPQGNCLYYSWFPPLGLSNPSSGNPIARPEVNTRYIVRGTTEGGCTVTDSVDVLVMEDSYVKLPNAFAPGNGRNGVFKLVGRGDFELKSFAVYNRWGVKMFETKDINEGWDGRFNDKPQPMGVYIYTVDGISPTGRAINKQGNVTLVR
ncbi:MAG: gliding motility-associated C-terminal domain-containing protein [Flavipsychrobacter sp.]